MSKLKYEDITQDRLKQLEFKRHTNTVPDVPLLRKEVEWVEEQAARLDEGEGKDDVTWRQETWVTTGYHRNMCGTNCCVAGKVAMDLGILVFTEDDPYAPVAVKDDDGVYWTISDFAAERLGLEGMERGMFGGDNAPGEIREYAEMAAKRVGEKL